jgi:hypothetical protein
MNTFNVGSVLILCGVLGACASPLAPTVPRASVGDFTDHVLEPLALRVADEKIIEAGAGLRFEQTQDTMHTVANLLYEVPWIGKLLSVRNVSQKAHLEEDLAWLETRRIALKRELLDLFAARTIHEGETFAFCVDGVQRRYQAIDTNRFTRLADGSGPCELKQLHSLKKSQSPLRDLF